MHFERPGTAPGTHALVIGVGGYRHLPNGTGQTFFDPTLFHGLGQLTSPPISAIEVADWLVTAQHELWKAPLASVDLLVSPHPAYVEVGCATAEPTIQNIRTAYRAWRKRASASRDNVALFYFCGHGLQSDTRRLLLASDFGADEGAPLLGAFEFEETRDACVLDGPATQCFFVDSCASSAPWLMERRRPQVPGLDSPANRSMGGYAATDTVTVLASQAYMAAGSLPKETSYFTRALLDAMSGGAARRNDFHEWAVHTTDIGDTIRSLLLRRPGAERQTPHEERHGKAELWRIADPPPVEISVACTPDAAHRLASLACEPFDVPDTRYVRSSPSIEPWLVRSQAGSHRFEATFRDDRYPVSCQQIDLLPPGSPIWLRVRS